MQDPLSSDIVELLRVNPTAALGALMVIGQTHGQLLSWAAQAISPGSVEPPPSRPNGHGRNGNGVKPSVRKRRGSGGHRGERGELDAALLEAMRASPGSTIGDLARAIGRSRSSTVLYLHRLREADLTESVGGKWRLVEPREPASPPQKWIRPLHGSDKSEHAHLT